MIRPMNHRSPDDFESWTSGPADSGNARLSIIDLAGERQPIPNKDGSS
jgi:asparagine synthetase B (glutamine-hydrolysing)